MNRGTPVLLQGHKVAIMLGGEKLSCLGGEHIFQEFGEGLWPWAFAGPVCEMSVSSSYAGFSGLKNLKIENLFLRTCMALLCWYQASQTVSEKPGTLSHFQVLGSNLFSLSFWKLLLLEASGFFSQWWVCVLLTLYLLKHAHLCPLVVEHFCLGSFDFLSLVFYFSGMPVNSTYYSLASSFHIAPIFSWWTFCPALWEAPLPVDILDFTSWNFQVCFLVPVSHDVSSLWLIGFFF